MKLAWSMAFALLACTQAQAVQRWSILVNDRVVELDPVRHGRDYHATTHATLDPWSVPWAAIPCPGSGVIPAGAPLVDVVHRPDGKFDVTIRNVRLIPVGADGLGTPPIIGCMTETANYTGVMGDREAAAAFDAAQLSKFPADHEDFLLLTMTATECPIPAANRYTCLGGRFRFNPIIDAPPVDSDGDGLPDEWEVFGLRVGGQFLDLPRMGADPNHKDLFVQVDATPWTRFESDVYDAIAESLAAEPVPNPDVRPGIRIHIDAGPDSIMDPRTRRTWGDLSRARETLSLPDHFTTYAGGGCRGFPDDRPFNRLREQRLEPVRRRLFRYAVIVKYLGPECHGGMTWGMPARGFVIANWRGAVATTRYVERGTFLHELGHSIGLDHGGRERTNFKPNYQSVMNYMYSHAGVPEFGWNGPGSYRYSSTVATPNNTLDLSRLDEAAGFKPVVPIDTPLKFRCPDGTYGRTTPLQPVDIDCDGHIVGGERAFPGLIRDGGRRQVLLRPFDDVNHLMLAVPREDGDHRALEADTATEAELLRAEAGAFGDRQPPTLRITLRTTGARRTATIVAHDDVSLASAVITVGAFTRVENLSAVDRFVREATRSFEVPATGTVTGVVGDAFGNTATATAR